MDRATIVGKPCENGLGGVGRQAQRPTIPVAPGLLPAETAYPSASALAQVTVSDALPSCEPGVGDATVAADGPPSLLGRKPPTVLAVCPREAALFAASLPDPETPVAWDAYETEGLLQ